MKDLFSKLTFGFIMAQLVPGVILVISLTIFDVCIRYEITTILDAFNKTYAVWFSPSVRLIVFLGLSVASGMAIHGLNWAVIGFLETHYATKNDKGEVKLKPVARTFWHNKAVAFQILLGPIKIFIEIFIFLTLGSDLHDIAIKENVQKIPEDKMEQFNFLQDFYLHFAQFYSHTSYALFVSIFAALVLICEMGPSLRRIGLTVFLYILCGFFFVIGRIQFQSLFEAETDLSEKPNDVRKESNA